MPEGDTIHRSAVRLRQALSGTSIVAANDNGRFVRSDVLVGATFESVEARGKHLLMHLEDGRVLHSHMGMTGSWHTYREDEPWRKAPGRAALAMVVEPAVVCSRSLLGPGKIDAAGREDAGLSPRQLVSASTSSTASSQSGSVVVCFSPKILDLLTATAYRRHPFVHRLGPDLMLEKPDEMVVLQRFRLHHFAPIGEAIMNQSIVSGIGNVYKSETLFLTKTNPFVTVGQLPDRRILAIVDKAQALMHDNQHGYPRRTRRRRDGERVWVYRRSGKPCFECGTIIRMRRQGDLGRSTYWCPKCQSDERMANRREN